MKGKRDAVILTIPDTHFPFVDKKRLALTLAQISSIKPDFVIQIGDLLDLYAYSRFPNSMNVATPHREVRDGKWMAGKMWADIKRLAPKAQCFQSWGNHEERPMKQIMRNAPALEELLKEPLAKLMAFPGVTTLSGPMDELDINGIRFIHGWSCKPGFHMNYFARNVVHGHTHHGGVTYLRLNGKTIWELDAGILADYDSLPMMYRSTLTCKWTPGFGLVDRYGPRFCPL